MHIETVTLEKLCRTTALTIIIITGINAFVAGCLFVIDPSGDKLGLTIDYLKFTPFNNYLIPGIILLLVNGIFNLTVAGLILARHKKAPVLIIVQGVLLAGWILSQVLMVRDFNMLHLVMGSFGVVLGLCGWYLHKEHKERVC